jgi:mono/diheme cytochrome c family protein
MKSLSRFTYCLPLLAISVVTLACDSQSEAGHQVFQQQCTSCHNADNNDRKMGPALKGLFHHEKLVTNGEKVTDANVRAKINEGGNGMPAFQETLSDEDKDHIVAYLKTL